MQVSLRWCIIKLALLNNNPGMVIIMFFNTLNDDGICSVLQIDDTVSRLANTDNSAGMYLAEAELTYNVPYDRYDELHNISRRRIKNALTPILEKYSNNFFSFSLVDYDAPGKIRDGKLVIRVRHVGRIHPANLR